MGLKPINAVMTCFAKGYSVINVKSQRWCFWPFLYMMCLNFKFGLTSGHLAPIAVSSVYLFSPVGVSRIAIISSHPHCTLVILISSFTLRHKSLVSTDSSCLNIVCISPYIALKQASSGSCPSTKIMGKYELYLPSLNWISLGKTKVISRCTLKINIDVVFHHKAHETL